MIGALFDSLINLSVGKLIKADTVSVDEFELYCFSMEVALLKIIHLISYFFVSLAMNKVIECIIIVAIFYTFRRNVGGYHAKTRSGCYLFSCFTIFVSLYLVDLNMTSVTQCFIALFALIVLITMKPVHNDNRPVDADEAIYFRHRLCFSVVIFVIFFIVMAIFSLWKLIWICTIGLLLAVSLEIFGKMQCSESK